MTPDPTTPAPAVEAPGGTPRPLAERLLGALALAFLGFVVIWLGAWALGFGRDVHPLRVAVTVAFLFPLGLVRGMERPRARSARLGMVLTTLFLGAMAWWETSAGMNGESLREAVEKRDTLLRQMGGPLQYDSIHGASHFRDEIDRLARYYPTLAAPLQGELNRWGADALAVVVERLRATPPHTIDAARDARSRGEGLARTFQEYRQTIVDEYDSWLRRGTRVLVDELNSVPAADWDGFNRTAAARRKLASAAQPRRDLIPAEIAWVKRSAGEVTEPVLRALDAKPEAVRTSCLEAERQIRTLKSINTPTHQFRATRVTLFRVAHDAAGREVLEHVHGGRYDRAFDTALRHGFEWSAAAQSLGSGEAKALADLREQARHLSIRFEKAGFVDAAPEPRSRETAPPPRSRP
jgi:hypothetical protein